MQGTFDAWEGEHLEHYGVLGMKWGIRKYQNSDGSLTPAGQKRYSKTGEHGYTYKSHATKKYERKAARAQRKADEDRKLASEFRSMPEDKYRIPAERTNAQWAQMYSQSARKRQAKAEKFKRRAERSRELDRREQDYAERVRVGGNIVARVLTNELVGGKAYQQHLAMNKDTTSRGSKVTAAVLSYWGGRTLSMLRKADYIRQDEKSAFRTKMNKTEAGYKKIIDAINNVDDLLKKKRG